LPSRLRAAGHCVLVAVISSGMLSLPIQAAEEQPFGVVALADQAHVGSAYASAGANVYPGDALDTLAGGSLRLRVATGQFYLLSASAANLGEDGSVLRATAVRGTMGFSSLTAKQFELETPEGMIRAANGLPAYGQITIAGPRDAVVSCYRGTLLLERNGQQLLVDAGKSYDVSLVSDPEPPQGKAGVTPAYADHLVWKLIVIGGAAIGGYFLWRHFTESPVDPR
jgi:hypothetical protein